MLELTKLVWFLKSKGIKNKFLCLLFIISVFNSAKAQDNYSEYYQLMNSYLVNEADGNFMNAYENLEYALQKFDGFSNWYDVLIENKLSKGDINSALKYAKKATLLGYQYYDFDIFDTTKNNVFFKDSVFVNKLKTNYPIWRKECLSKRNDFDFTLNTELQKMSSEEQFIRVFIHQTNKPSTWVYTNIADSINYFQLKSIIIKNGFPKRQKLDFKSYKSLMLMLTHMRTLSCVTTINESEMEWLDSIMKANVFCGNIHPTDYAFAIDRYTCFLNSKVLKKKEIQIYGECNYSEKFTDIFDIINVDKRRKSIYLVPLKYKSKFAQLTLPIGYKYNLK